VRIPDLGLRARIALALALVCLLVIGALGAVLYVSSERLEESLIDTIVSDEMGHVVRRHQENPAFMPQPGASLRAYIVRSAEDESRLPEPLRRLGPGRHEVYGGKDEFHVLVRDERGVRFYVAYEIGLHEQRESEFQVLVLLSVIAGSLGSLGLGYLVSGLLVAEVSRLALKVSTLKPGQPREPLARPGQDTDVALLARAFDDYHARIESLIRREQEFTANASHELRTPLTAIRTSCELLLADHALSGKARARAEQIDAAAARMTEQIQALFLLARGQSLGETERVVLANCVGEAAEPYRAEIARKALAFEVAVAPDAVLDINYQALRFVLTNLIRNAVQYTDHGFIRIGYAPKRLTVADSGRGIKPENLPRVFERFFRDVTITGGLGLGLSIVKGICDRYGWKIKVESAPMKGSAFSITFP